jgi:hypothetical protein
MPRTGLTSGCSNASERVPVGSHLQNPHFIVTCVTRKTGTGRTCGGEAKREGINDCVYHILGKRELRLKELRKGCLFVTLQLLRTLKLSRGKYKETHKSALFNQSQRRLEDVFLASGNVL